MSMPAGDGAATPESLGRIVALVLHTIFVYVLAVDFSPWIVNRIFDWVLPVLRISPEILAANWYLQHLEVVTIVPAFAAGYVLACAPKSIANWAWLGPTAALIYRLSTYHPQFSVFAPEASFFSRFEYFFVISRSMPIFGNSLIGDPLRTLAQMGVTAPFYAGVAYSVGAWASRHHVLKNLFIFERIEPEQAEKSERMKAGQG